MPWPIAISILEPSQSGHASSQDRAKTDLTLVRTLVYAVSLYLYSHHDVHSARICLCITRSEEVRFEALMTFINMPGWKLQDGKDIMN